MQCIVETAFYFTDSIFVFTYQQQTPSSVNKNGARSAAQLAATHYMSLWANVCILVNLKFILPGVVYIFVVLYNELCSV